MARIKQGNPLPQGGSIIPRFDQNYKAAYQKAAAVVIVATTKSGSNFPEADLFAYGVGNSYVAKDAYTARSGTRPTTAPSGRRQVVRPIIKNKLFYFGTYELNFRDDRPSPAGRRYAFRSASVGGHTAAVHRSIRAGVPRALGFRKLTYNASSRNHVGRPLHHSQGR